MKPITELPEGDYMFADRSYPLAELAMGEAPPALQAMLVEHATRNGVRIRRDQVVELRCVMDGHREAAFTIYWPQAEACMLMLMPSRHVVGRA